MPLAPEIEKRVDGLRRQWGCTINLKLQPPNMGASVSRVREIRHLISEAVSNAVRHGSACEVQIEIHQTSDQLEIRVLDNGSGFDISIARNKIVIEKRRSRHRFLNIRGIQNDCRYEEA